MAKTTCQICEREIKSSTGLIAHHGYKRPIRGSGWQTGSCMGARHLPYEQSRDLIPTAIKQIVAYLKIQKDTLKTLKARPEFLTRLYPKSQYGIGGTDKVVKFSRETPRAMVDGTFGNHYEQELRSQIFKAEREIGFARGEAKRMQKRYDEWVPPKKTA